MRTTVFILCFCFALSIDLSQSLLPPEIRDEFIAWKRRYNKVYHTEKEEKYRRKIWTSNSEEILKHNLIFMAGNVSFSRELNHFSDMTFDEFKSKILCENMGQGWTKDDHPTESTETPSRDVDWTLPSSVNWTAKGAVSPVEYQGACGSCYAFSVAQAVESQMAIRFRKRGRLSKQQLVDCSRSSYFGNQGCGGGFLDKSMLYMTHVGGLMAESKYPYKERTGACMFTPKMITAKVVGYKRIEDTENAVREAVAKMGPVSVAIHANQNLETFSGREVYHDPSCDNKPPNHAVLITGYGTTSYGWDYWIIKNSWGKDWADNGYAKIIRNHRGNCGILKDVNIPLVN